MSLWGLLLLGMSGYWPLDEPGPQSRGQGGGRVRGQGGSKSKAFRAKVSSSGPQGPATPQLQPQPMSIPPQPHLQSHIHTHTCSTHAHMHRGLQGPRTHTLDPRNVSGLVPSGQIHSSRNAKGMGPLCTTDWLPRRHLSNHYTRPLVLTDLSR